MIDCACGIYPTKNDHPRLGGTDSKEHPLKGDCQQKTPIHRKMVSFFAGLPHRIERQPWSGPHPVFHLLVICNQAPIRIKVAEERRIAGCAAKRYSKSRSAATSLSSKDP
jgi:hypothetical protein